MKEKDAQTKYDKKELSYASNSVARIDDLLGSIATDWENWVIKWMKTMNIQHGLPSSRWMYQPMLMNYC